MDYSITAEFIRNARIRRGITQKELAARLGVTNTAVSENVASHATIFPSRHGMI